MEESWGEPDEVSFPHYPSKSMINAKVASHLLPARMLWRHLETKTFGHREPGHLLEGGQGCSENHTQSSFLKIGLS